MGIKKKLFLITAAAMTSLLVLSYAIIYFYLYHTMYEETLIRQRASVELNRQMANNFVRSVYHTAVQVVSDKALGGYLSLSDTADTLTLLTTREAIRAQFSHYATHQVIDSTYYYKNILFLSDKMPITAAFDNYTLDTNPYASSNIVFSNANVKDEEWYRQTVDNIIHVFTNEPTAEFCIARKINNSFYKGSNIPEGNAVMVVSVALDQLENVFANVPVTAHSGYAVLSQEGEILFHSNPDIRPETYEAGWTAYLQSPDKEVAATLLGEKYLLSHCEAEYGIQLLFLTPTRDIADNIRSPMHTYSSLFLFIILAALLVTYILSGGVTGPLIRLSQAISEIQDTREFDKSTLHVSGEKEIMALENSFSQLIDKTNLLIEDIRIQGEREKRSQLRSLQAQINPHFIFNAMDMINWLALSRNCDDIAEIVDSIANLMRYSITNADGMVPIGQELDNIREFVSIYQLRHDNKLQLSCNIMAADITIPKFTLQPLVENSIRHAAPPQEKGLSISVTAYKQGETDFIIEVTDNGCKADADQLNLHLQYQKTHLEVSSGFGIRNVNERIHLWFREDSGLQYFIGEHGGLTARITLHHPGPINNDNERNCI